MRCSICHSTDKWENADKYRLKEEGMCICTKCGFVSYPNLYKSKEEIIKYYEEDYRSTPQVGNIYSSQRKLHYHSHMLVDVFDKWRKDGLNKPVVTDVGAAFGMFLDWVRHSFPEGDYKGVELTKSFVRNAWHLYQLKLEQDFDDTKKYDLIGSYKSLEHIMDPDVELTRYIDSLAEDGVLYLSVPIWFRTMCNFGAAGWSLEYYYHPNHINVWNLEQFEALVKVCGGEIVEANHELYESSYLIKRNEALKTDDRTSLYQDPNKIKASMQKIFAASEAYDVGNHAEAINIWPKFPYAHIARYENNRKKLNDLGFDTLYEEVCLKAIKACPDEADMQYLAADICMRYNKYELAVEHLQKCQGMRPNMPNAFIALSNTFRTLAENAKTEEERIRFYEKARESAKMLKDMSLQNFADATNWIMFDNSKIPTPHEG